jgi:type IV secretory pathway TrbD component
MADEAEQPEGALPPPTEEVHLPGPSYLPAVLALGLMIAIVGVIKTWVIVAIGLIIFLVALVKWIRQARQEMSQLPLEH